MQKFMNNKNNKKTYKGFFLINIFAFVLLIFSICIVFFEQNKNKAVAKNKISYISQLNSLSNASSYETIKDKVTKEYEHYLKYYSGNKNSHDDYIDLFSDKIGENVFFANYEKAKDKLVGFLDRGMTNLINDGISDYYQAKASLVVGSNYKDNIDAIYEGGKSFISYIEENDFGLGIYKEEDFFSYYEKIKNLKTADDCIQAFEDFRSLFKALFNFIRIEIQNFLTNEYEIANYYQNKDSIIVANTLLQYNNSKDALWNFINNENIATNQCPITAPDSIKVQFEKFIKARDEIEVDKNQYDNEVQKLIEKNIHINEIAKSDYAKNAYQNIVCDISGYIQNREYKGVASCKKCIDLYNELRNDYLSFTNILEVKEQIDPLDGRGDYNYIKNLHDEMPNLGEPMYKPYMEKYDKLINIYDKLINIIADTDTTISEDMKNYNLMKNYAIYLDAREQLLNSIDKDVLKEIVDKYNKKANLISDVAIINDNFRREQEEMKYVLTIKSDMLEILKLFYDYMQEYKKIDIDIVKLKSVLEEDGKYFGKETEELLNTTLKLPNSKNTYYELYKEQYNLIQEKLNKVEELRECYENYRKARDDLKIDAYKYSLKIDEFINTLGNDPQANIFFYNNSYGDQSKEGTYLFYLWQMENNLREYKRGVVLKTKELIRPFVELNTLFSTKFKMDNTGWTKVLKKILLGVKMEDLQGYKDFDQFAKKIQEKIIYINNSIIEYNKLSQVDFNVIKKYVTNLDEKLDELKILRDDLQLDTANIAKAISDAKIYFDLQKGIINVYNCPPEMFESFIKDFAILLYVNGNPNALLPEDLESYVKGSPLDIANKKFVKQKFAKQKFAKFEVRYKLTPSELNKIIAEFNILKEEMKTYKTSVHTMFEFDFEEIILLSSISGVIILLIILLTVWLRHANTLKHNMEYHREDSQQ